MTDAKRWSSERDSADGARRADDWAGYRRHVDALWRLAPGHPRLVLALARSAARLGDADAAVAWLRRYAAMGLTGDVTADSDFTALARDVRVAAVRARLRANARPVRHADSAFVLDTPDLVAEDIAWDGARRRFLVSSVRERRVVAVRMDGAAEPFTAPAESVWAVLGLAADSARGFLWAATAATAPALGIDSGAEGRTALVAFDLASGRVRRRVEPPQGGEPRLFGDLTLGADGSVLVTDSRRGDLWRLRPDVDTFEQLVPAGTFLSPQQPAISPDGRTVLVPDYVRGLAVVELDRGSVRWLAPPDDLTPAGIDGLLACDGAFIAFQNGIAPVRVIRFRVDPAARRVTDWAIVESGTADLTEPTHGTRAGGAVYYIANAGWDRFDDAGAARPDVAPVRSRVHRLARCR